MYGLSEMSLALLTVLHLLTDGVCGAVLARYAFNELNYEPIVFWFSAYTIIAFGLQGLIGYVLDKFPRFLKAGLLVAAGLLFMGVFHNLPIWSLVIFIGLGNCLFHVAGGSIVLRSSADFSRPGCFVAGGAIGLGLGLGGLVGVYPFAVADMLLTLLALKILPQDFACKAMESVGRDAVPLRQSIIAVLLLFGCIVLRGFGGNSNYSLPVLVLPGVFTAGKIFGGMLADRIGFRRAILFIFLLSFVSVQFEGMEAALIFIFACNMTMPLTLRLAHRCFLYWPGLMFGLAATCLVPGAIFKGLMSFPPALIASLQFIILAACGHLLMKGAGE